MDGSCGGIARYYCGDGGGECAYADPGADGLIASGHVAAWPVMDALFGVVLFVGVGIFSAGELVAVPRERVFGALGF